MNFQQIQDRVKDHLIDLPAATLAAVPEMVNAAIREATDMHNFTFMEMLLSAQTSTGSRTLVVAKPALWKEADAEPHLLLPSGRTKRLSWLPSRSEALRTYAETLPQSGDPAPADEGEPLQLLETATRIEVYPFPDNKSTWPGGNYQVRIPYFSRPAVLANGADSNWLTNNAATYVILRAASFGFIMNREEERAAVYAGRLEQRGGVQTAFSELARVIALDKRSKLPGRLTIAPRKGVFQPVMHRR